MNEKTNEKTNGKTNGKTSETVNPISSEAHVPVFLDAVMTIFKSVEKPVRLAFDGTFGRGGHTGAMLENWPTAKVVAFDWDETAIAFGSSRLAAEIVAGRLKLVRSSYSDFKAQRPAIDPDSLGFDLMLLDLGVSSPQLDSAERGFSFYHEGPLDMRMDQRCETTAADIVNGWDEQDLAKLFIEYGEIRQPFRVVKAIAADRKGKKPFTTTRELASMIERVDGWHKKGSHPATRYFLALRLKVNEELSNLHESLPDMIEGLSDGGILAVITFHSLEDRIVKNIFKDHLHCGQLVHKKVIQPDEAELARNPRSRSAKLRAFRKGKEQ